jgi:predicted nucleic acid-binding protein
VVLVDTSAWLLDEPPDDFLRLIREEPVAIWPPVVQELLQGAYDERRTSRVNAIESSSAMLDSPVPLARFEFAGDIYRVIRAASFTIRSSNDCLIAAIAMHHDVTLLHGDRDFDYIVRFFPLRARNIIPSASRS